MSQALTDPAHLRRRQIEAFQLGRRVARPRLLRLARHRLRLAAIMRQLWIESEKQLDRHMARWAKKLILLDTVDGEARARRLTPEEIEILVQKPTSASADDRRRRSRTDRNGGGPERASGWSGGSA